jgi:hypothetical protein
MKTFAKVLILQVSLGKVTEGCQLIAKIDDDLLLYRALLPAGTLRSISLIGHTDGHFI